MRILILLGCFFVFLTGCFYSQSINDIGDQYWKAVSEKDYKNQIEYGPKIVEYYEQNNFPIDTAYLDFLFRLGTAYYSLNDFENSRITHAKSLKYCEVYFGIQNINTLMHKYALTHDYSKLGLYESLIPLAQNCLNGFDDFFGEENDYSLLMLQYLSRSYELTNNLDSALYFAERQKTRSLKLKGENSEANLYAIYNLARIYKSQYKFKEAITLYENCLRLSQLFFIKNHFTYESSLYNLGDIYIQLGDLNKSIQFGQECLIIQKDVFGENSLNYSKTLLLIASAYRDLGNYDQSLKLDLECLRIRENLFGETNELTLESLNNIALTYSLKGSLMKSFEINKKIVKQKKINLGENNFSYIQSLSNLAVDYSNLSMIDSSYILNSKVYSLLESNKLNNISLYGTNTKNLAFYHLNYGDINKAEVFIEMSLETFKSLFGENSLDYFESLKISVAIDELKGNNEKAFIDLNKIHNFCIINYGFESFLYAKSLTETAGFLNDKGYYTQAIDSIQKALPIYIKSQGENHVLSLQTKSSLALYLNNSGKYYEGLKINLDVLERRYKILGFRHKDYITSLVNIAKNFKDIHDFESSRKYLLKAISIQENDIKFQSPDTYSTSLSNYGNVLLNLEIKDSAFYYSNKALTFTRKMLGMESEKYIIQLNNIGAFFIHFGIFAKAKIYFDSAYVISEKIFGANHPTTIQCYENLAATYGDMNNYSKAIDIEMECLKRIAERRGSNNLEYASGLNQLAFYDSKIGLDSLALLWNKDAHKIRKEILGSKHPKTLLSAFNLATDYSNLQQFDKSLEINNDLLKVYLELYGEKSTKIKYLYNNIGLVYLKLKDYKNALSNLLKSYENGDQHEYTGTFLLNISSSYEKQNEWNNAILFEEKAVNWYLEDYLINQIFLTDIEKSNYKSKLDYYISYLIYLNQKNGFKDSELRWYEYYISAKNLINIQNTIENMKMTQVEKSDLKIIVDRMKILKAQRNNDIELNQNLNVYQKEIEKLEIKYSSLAYKFLQKPLELEMIQNQLPSNESVFVDIISFRDQSENLNKYISVISSKTGVNFCSFNKEIDLEDLFVQYNQEATDSEYKTDLKSEKFFNYFWKPIADKIGDAKTIYVSLGGVYNNINLNTLYNPKTGKYLLEEKDIRIVNSARDFVLSKEQEKKIYTTNTASLFGFPDFNGNTTISVDTSDLFASIRDLNSFWLDSLTRGGLKANPLPATKIEVENISLTLKSKGWQVNSYLAENASETNIKKQESPRILHIATHGYFFPDIPIDKDNTRFLGMDRKQVVQDPMLRSGLLFTGANKTLKGEETKGENGLLSAAEASLLDLRETELVVLSACETGKGEVKNSEGVYGLRKAFSDAGAKNIIMSLWKVDDKVTQEFMSRFYEIWLNDKTTIREAFNKTQLEIKAKYPEPYYWGAFILVGE
jgi:CHAT domain-containing protein/tetratricopeptide (TPR) repeat protein